MVICKLKPVARCKKYALHTNIRLSLIDKGLVPLKDTPATVINVCIRLLEYFQMKVYLILWLCVMYHFPFLYCDTGPNNIAPNNCKIHVQEDILPDRFLFGKD